jgi:antitoxin FitA
MKNFNIRKVDDAVYFKIKTMAASKGRSMEAELREIVTKAAAQTPVPRNLIGSIRARIQQHGGIDLEIPPRESPRETVKFSA